MGTGQCPTPPGGQYIFTQRLLPGGSNMGCSLLPQPLGEGHMAVQSSLHHPTAAGGQQPCSRWGLQCLSPVGIRGMGCGLSILSISPWDLAVVGVGVLTDVFNCHQALWFFFVFNELLIK